MVNKNRFLKLILPLGILLAGVLGSKALMLSREGPKKGAQKAPGALVEIMTVKQNDCRAAVIATGTVQACREITLVPQVSGRVEYISPGFVAGGFFKTGELLVSIESTDYELALEKAKSALAKAELDLATMESQARIARLEWDGLGRGKEAKANPLVLYEPQMKSAEGAVVSAKAAIRQAEIDLERTRIKAPFNCRIRSEEVDVGQYVRSGNSIAVLSGTDKAEIIVPLPLEELQWVHVPGPNGNRQTGSKATASLAGATSTWEARIVRSLGEVDPRGRMARVVLEVKDPYGLSGAGASTGQALEIGMFVEVAIEGRPVTGTCKIPRAALRDNSTVWMADEKGLLRIRPVEVLRREKDTVLISDGLKDKDRLVLTALTGAVDGMKLRIVKTK